jgi:TolB protein
MMKPAVLFRENKIAAWTRLQRAAALMLIGLLALMACAEEPPTEVDDQAPTVEVKFPHPNTSVSGLVLIRVEATDNVTVTRVEFYIDDILRQTAVVSPWEYTWETLFLVNGSKHTIMAKAFDSAGNVGTSEEINVVVNNEINDPPTANIIAPEDSTSYALGEEIAFFGEGHDALGTTLQDDQLTWFSDRDGFLGLGASLSRDDLSADWHRITLVATDDRELIGKDSISVHISTEATLLQITHDEGTEEYPCWSPNSQNIAYASDREGNFDIWLITSSGGTPTQLTSDPSFDWEPDWHGSEILFTSYRSGNADIWKISDSGADITQVTDHPGWDVSASWSPDGEHIVVSSQMGGAAQMLWVLSMNGDDPEQLTDQPAYEPDWFIGDVAYRSWDQNLYVTSLAGMTPVQITWDLAWDASPSWSPDGDAIVFSSGRTGNEDIWIWSFLEGRLTQLTFHSGRDYQPSWSPDGDWIAFVSDRNGTPDIWIIAVQ